MRHSKPSFLMGMLWLTIGAFGTLSLCAQSPSSPPQSPVRSKTDEAKEVPKSTAGSPTETPTIDPDVKQWYLERLKQRLPYDPKDVEILTGRYRDSERMMDYFNNGFGFWGSTAWGFYPDRGGQWRSQFQSPFMSPGFFLFGNRQAFRGGSFFFAQPFFRPFNFGGSGRRSWGGRW